jgi:D-glycero-D-manno-heptose 1,7-bisphosphate phosphatase
MAMVGDKYSDMQAGFRLNCKTVMVNTGYGLGEYAMKRDLSWPRQPDLHAENLLEAVNMLTKTLI